MRLGKGCHHYSHHPSCGFAWVLVALMLLGCAVSGGLLRAKALAPAAERLDTPDKTPEGLSKSDWTGIRVAHEGWKHSFQPIKSGWQARNPGQQWTTKFDARGFLTTPKEAAWTWGLELTSYGMGEHQTPVGASAPAIKAEGQRLSYQWDVTIQEWWVNDTRGLEHGYTISQRPSSPTLAVSSSLILSLTTRGNLQPKITPDALGVLFQDDSGTTVLNYTGLKVWDADGKTLVSRFEAAEEKTIRLVVDDHAARYPITIDPIAQQAYLKAHQVNAGDNFGFAVAVSGDTVVVGAHNEDSNTTGVKEPLNKQALSQSA
jgi:trimeric autotransporter adhesin